MSEKIFSRWRFRLPSSDIKSVPVRRAISDAIAKYCKCLIGGLIQTKALFQSHFDFENLILKRNISLGKKI